MGVLRVGTLYDFRESEHKQGIADPKEGKKEVFHLIGENPTSSEVKDLEQFGLIINSNHPGSSIKNCVFKKSIDVPDCFIFCTSKVFSKETMQEFSGANSCYEISNPNNFYHVLTETLNSFVPVVFRGVHEVIYQSKVELWNGKDWGRHPALIKEQAFFKQSEIRAIWQPRLPQHIQPMIVTNYRLTESCRALAI